MLFLSVIMNDIPKECKQTLIRKLQIFTVVIRCYDFFGSGIILEYRDFISDDHRSLRFI